VIGWFSGYFMTVYELLKLFTIAKHDNGLAIQMMETVTFLSITGPKGPMICFQFIAINSLHMFRALICSSSGDAVYTTIGTYFFVRIMSAGC
jgi:hypothetical protein